MIYKWICVVGCISLLMYSCSRKQDIQDDCFQPFSILATDYFGTKEPQRWKIIGKNAGDDFLKENEILGFVVDSDFSSFMEPLVDREVLKFTGRVYKFWPSWPEKYLGGGRKNIQYEVLIGYDKYLIFDERPRNKRIPSVEKRCDF
ncbi:hypothetical protein [Vibrio metschnikovii]|uniref:hypothetical protein n=1 Tax=Vibrio metschnikovii TaxID=28172 RepID=UPI001C30B559|nr:hypothetical protein [Vibrio metschnikovii]